MEKITLFFKSYKYLDIPITQLPSEIDIHSRYKNDVALFRRRNVLRDTVAKFQNEDLAMMYRLQATVNLKRWNGEFHSSSQYETSKKIEVISGDWGVVTQEMTKKYGHIFAVLNLASPKRPGGGCDEGMIAQEENIYRRTDCRVLISPNELEITCTGNLSRNYNQDASRLIKGKYGKVALDMKPRICIKGPENTNGDGTGYKELPLDDIFPFYELRSSALDRRELHYPEQDDVEPFTLDEQYITIGKIAAQLDTLIEKKIKHVILGAFGCGAFKNPTIEVAKLYKEELYKRKGFFDVVVFAIYHAGYGPNNFSHFYKELHGCSF